MRRFRRMRDLHILISKETHDRLVAAALRHPKAKNKSEYARLVLDAGLDTGALDVNDPVLEDIRRKLSMILERLDRIDEDNRFTGLAFGEVFIKRPGFVDDLRRRARGERRAPPPPPSPPRPTGIPPIDKPRGMSE